MDDRAVLTGNLKFICLADLFQILGGNNSTGILRITSRYAPNPGHIYFHNGNPVNADYGSIKGLRAVQMLFGIIEGDFEFRQAPLQVKRSIKQNRMQLILDALRLLDDGEIRKLGPAAADTALDQAKAKTKSIKDLPLIEGPMMNYAYIVRDEFFEDGAEIVKEGAHGKWMWIILDGKVRVSRSTAGETLNIARIGKGCFIGTIKSILYGDHSRTATVTAEGDVRLGLLDTNRLYMDHESLSPEFKTILSSLDNRLRKITNRAVELFSGENGADSGIKEKKMVFDKTDSSQSLYTIRHGEAIVVAQTRSGPLSLVRLEERDIFGYIPFMDIGHEPRAATIMATADLITDRIDGKDIQTEYNRLSSTLRNFIYHLGTCISMTTAQALGFTKQNM